MVQARTMLRAIILTQDDPGAVLSQMNGLLLDELDENRFITLMLSCLDRKTRTLRYASAGHTTGYLLGSNGLVKAELPSTGVPLGLIAGAAFETVAIAGIEDGDIVALFTDGIVESVDEGAYYGPEGALAEIRRHRQESATDIVHHLCQAAQAHANGPQVDDMTVVVCRVGARPRHAGAASR
jgi:sigma-B regulation protein RsbU (phosphoserine phosphatase)